jgi:DNA-binding MarR family transcriptional regulator
MPRLHLDNLEEEILRSIRRIVRAIEIHSQSLVHAVGLTSPQLSVLKAVRRLDPATPTTIARELSLSQPTVSGILDRLHAKNLLLRGNLSNDKRMRQYRLTPDAAKMLSDAPPLLQESFLRELRQLKDWERSMLLASLQRVAGLMDVGGVEAHPVLTSGVDLLGADLER